MCGFVGIKDSSNKKEKEEYIKKMADKIIHRGPDSDGYYIGKDVALGFRRLSIIDLKGGSQPLYNENKDIALVFNGEIYNYKDLREDLKAKGHVFKTNTDSEVIVHGYEEYNTKIFSMLRGMFAILIYDIKNEIIVGARDHFGIKPFYYYKNDDVYLFGSEIKSFLEYPLFKKEVNKKALKMYLIFQYSIYEETFFKNVYKLKPGHFFVIKDNKMKITRYFEPIFDKTNYSYDKYKKELKEVLEESVYAHQISSDVEVGSYLSGGVDSSYVASVAVPDKTFSVGFKTLGFDETDKAQELSKILKISNKREYVSAEEFFNILPTIQYYTDEPHANLSTVPLFFLSDLASKDVKVVLSGEGADEMFGGYPEYNDPLAVRLYSKLPTWLKAPLAKVVKPLPHFPGKNTLVKYAKPFYERYIGHAFVMDENEANEILCDDLKDNVTLKDILYPYYEKVKDKDELTKKMYIDYHFWLPQDILLKADKMSMAHSLELRVPLLDIKLFDYSRHIPSKFMIKNKQTKYMFRDVAYEKMPDEWAARRKMGFPVPFSKWIKEDKYYKMVKKYFNEKYVGEFFDKEFINKLLEDHYNGKANNGRKIYNIFIFLIWYKVYFN